MVSKKMTAESKPLIASHGGDILRKTLFIAVAGAGALVGMLVGCSSEPTVRTGQEAETVMGSLNRVDNVRADMAYIDPSIDYRNYHLVRVLPLNLDHVEIIQPNSSYSIKNRSSRDWTLTDADRANLANAFQETFVSAIDRTEGFSMTEQTGEGVLAIEAMVTRIAPTAPKDDSASRGAGRNVVYSQGAGSMSVTFTVTDDHSGEVLALMKDTRSGQHTFWGPNNRVSNLAEVRRMLNQWSMQISRGLSYMRSLSEEKQAN